MDPAQERTGAMRRRIWTGVVAAVAALLAVGGAAAGPALPEIRLAVVGGSPSFTAVWLGVESGIFEKYGVRVTLLSMNGSVALETLSSGDIQIAGDGQTMVQADPTGTRLAFVAALQNEFAGFMVYARPQFHSIKDLKGQDVAGTTPAATSTFALSNAIRRAGLDPVADVKWSYLGTPPSQTAALTKGVIAAAVLPWPFNFAADKAGLRMLADLKGWHLPAAATNLAVRRDWAAAHQQTLIAFLKGLIESTARAKSEKAAAEKVIAKYLKITDPAQLDAGYYRFASVWPNPPYITREAVAEAIRDVPSPEAKKHAPADFIDNGPLDAIVSSGFMNQFGHSK
jgi:ABC-type nitrate/sulfonate/bicarbonate transport system substrate-binding protein